MHLYPQGLWRFFQNDAVKLLQEYITVVYETPIIVYESIWYWQKMLE